jgi:hypothetical protein
MMDWMPILNKIKMINHRKKKKYILTPWGVTVSREREDLNTCRNAQVLALKMSNLLEKKWSFKRVLKRGVPKQINDIKVRIHG